MPRSLLILIGLAVLVSDHAYGVEPEAKIKPIATVEIKPIEKDRFYDSWLGFSNDGKMLVTMHKLSRSTQNTQIRILDPLTGKVLVNDEADCAVAGCQAILIDSESQWLSVGSIGILRKYTISTEKVTRIAYKPEEERIISVAQINSPRWISPKGDALYVYENTKGIVSHPTLFHYDLKSGTKKKVLELSYESSNNWKFYPHVAIDFNSRQVAMTAYGGDKWVELWSLEGKKQLKFETEIPISVVQFSPDSKSLAVGQMNGVVSYHDVETGKELWKVFNPEDEFTPKGVFFDPKGKYCFYATTSGYINCIDVQKKKIIRSTKAEETINCFAMSKDGKRLATSNLQIQLWNTEDFTKP